MFLVHSLTAERPFLDLRLLGIRNVALGYILISLFGMLNFTPMVLLPTLLRQHVEYPDALVGWIVGSRGIGGLMGFFTAMMIEKLDPRLSISAGFLMLLISGLWLMQINLDVTPLEIILNGILQGLSVGIVIVPLAIVTFSDLDPRYRPEATGIFHLLRNIASSLFISLCVAEIVRSTGTNYARMAEFISVYNKALSWPSVIGAWDMATLSGLLRISKEVGRQSAMIAYLNTFGWFTAVSAVAMPVALLIGRPRSVPVSFAAPTTSPSAQE